MTQNTRLSGLFHSNTTRTSLSVTTPTADASPSAPGRSMRRLLLALGLMLACSWAWAADYVFISNETNGYFINSSAAATQTFTVETCVWSCINTNNNTANSLSYTNARRLRIGDSYLNGSNSNSGTVSIGTTRNTYWYSDGTNLYYYRSAYRQVYRDGTAVKWYGTSNPFRVYSSYSKTDEVFTVAPITGVDDVLTATGTFNLSSAASYTPEYYKFTGPDTRYYASGYTTGAVTTAISAKTSGFTSDTWTITPATSGITINSSGRLSYTTQVTNDTQITITHTVTENGKTKTAEKTITLYSANIATPTITRSGNSITLATTSIGATIHYTTDGSTPTASSPQYTSAIDLSSMTMPVTIKTIAVRNSNSSDVASATYSQLAAPSPMISISSGTVTITVEDGFTIYYTTNGDNPTVGASGTSQYTGTFNVTNQTTVKAIAVKTGYDNSAVASAEYVVSSVSGGTVILNDYEDHNWAYYKGREGVKVGTAADAPDYNDKYKYTLYSPDPRNVKITYRGYNTENSTIVLGSNTVATSTLNENTAPHVSNATGEGQNTFVYYKTLEKFVIGYFTDNADWNGIPDDPTKENYPYTIISNPFSVRPSTGSGTSKKYYGFAGWKIVRGGKYIGRGNGGTYTAASDGDVLGLDELIHFVNLDADVTYTPNCTSAEVVLEATWTEATVWSGTTAHTFSGGTYETNFIVASGNITTQISQGSPCTIIGMNPDGTGDNSGTRTITGLKVTTTSTTDPYDRSNCVKVEWILHGNGTFDANGRNLTMGRGITSSSNGAQGNVYGNNTQNQDVVNTVKVESGYYSGIANINNKAATATNAINSYVIMGCDYDRALANYYVPANEINNNAYNIKLRASRIYGPNGNPDLHRAYGQLYMRSLFKSGVFASEIGNEYYFHTYQRPGQRYIEMEGGYNKGHVKGGSDGATSQGRVRAMSIRMKGGRIDGQLACGSTSTFCSGDRLVVITGGRIGGWLAPGSNCSGEGSATGTTGTTDGTSYVYFGGTAEINSHQFGSTPSMIYQSTGGVIYGAGLGYRTTDRTGEMTLGSNIVFADEAYTERGIYGGGAIGQALTTANIFILGGRVGTGTGQIKDQGTNTTYDNVKAGVYGGACNRGGENSFIYMDGGIVESGIYGGANINGTMNGNVTMQINGGQVGYAETEANANVHGGGYGQPTRVTGNVDVSIGKLNAESGATIYGDVYGGSALGYVNGTAASTTKHTNVTLNAGTINGSLYGGGLGDNTNAANVYGPVQVTVNGGTVNTTSVSGSGAVYGCNNINGAPQSTVNVDIYGTDPAPSADAFALDAVYGGGNEANYTGTPVVTVHNCDNSIAYVYGGGNAAAVAATDVTIYGGDKIGNVFGGGNGQVKAANVNGNTNVKIYGGTIGDVYGGSNTNGTIGGAISVNVNATAESGKSACLIDIDNVYGGGNKAASKAGSITIGCAEHIGAVYGGANQANVTGDINLKIESGHIDNVFGGNNNSGTISGTIVVTIEDNENTCGMKVGNVYGAGNQAAYTNTGAYPAVNILKGDIIGDVFGGGLGETAIVTSNPAVLINGGKVTGNVFGGGSEADTKGSTTVTIQAGSVGNAVYGGGALANVTGKTTVNLLGGTVNDVYGGGLGRNASGTEGSSDYLPAVAALVGGDTNVTLGGRVSGSLVSSIVTGSIFGCNNVNGTPKGHAKVTVLKTTAQSGAAADAYHVAAVYGGGNQAAYIPTSSTDIAEVEVIGCDNSIEYVYGGGNAASTPATKVTIEGGTLYYVFGGGNGAGEGNPGADVGYLNHNTSETYGEGTTNVYIYGGIINSVFGGSNTKGNIRVASNVTLNDKETCEYQVGDVYGAGNEAEMYGDGNLIIGCIPGLREIYGGAKNADIHGDVTLTITNGEFEKVFGGNNLGGNIDGSVTVNIEETGCRPIIIGELYGGGNLAAYTAPTGTEYGENAGKFPMVNVKSCTSIGTVYGGGLGMPDAKIDALSADDLKEAAKALGQTDAEIEALSDDELKALTKPFFKAKGVVNGSPQVNIGLIEGKFANGGSHGSETFPAISNEWDNQLGTIGTVYGGGNAAATVGDTYVNIGTMSTINLVSGEDHSDKPVQGVNIKGNVYGGGNAADVTGKTNVVIGQ